MSVYQILNEENQLFGEYVDMQQAMYSEQDFTVWDEEHYYHVEELELEVV